VIATTAKKAPVPIREATAVASPAPPGEAATREPPESGPGEAAVGSLFGSTRRPVAGSPLLKPALGNMTMLAVRISIEDPMQPAVIVRFYEGKPIDPYGVAGEKAFADARVCLGALEVAIKRAGMPPRPAISGSGLEPRA
jgi:hypothetical protein